MRRAALQALRTARRNPVHRLIGSKTSQLAILNGALGTRSISSTPKRYGRSQILLSSMRFPTYPVFTLLALLGGVYYYQDGRVSDVGAWMNGDRSAARKPQATTAPQHGQYSSLGALPEASQLSFNNADAEPTETSRRRTLIVQDDQFYVGDLSEDAPLSKEAEDPSQQILAMLTPEQATQKLRRSEESYFVGRGRGVVRYDLVQLPSNNPIEDDHAEKIVEVSQTVMPTQDGSSSSDWMFWGVFDGHSGWTTSAKLRQVLISFVARELNATYKSAQTDPAITFPVPEAIDMAIKKGFLRLDHEIIHESVQKVLKNKSKRAAAEILAPAFSGSCALLSFYDSRSKLFRVACTGDSRAVLGRRGPTGKWVATALSEDQTGGTPSEMARLRAEHPGEDNVVRNGRILGSLQPSRAFGDSCYKWSRDVQDRMKANFFGRSVPTSLRTPPYVTAEPVVTTTKVHPETGDFVVLATDGLWEMLSNEEVVGLVGQWLDSQPLASATGAGSTSNKQTWLKSWFGSNPGKSLPVEKASTRNNGQPGDEGQRIPLRQAQWNVPGGDARFVVEDKNAATHLVRNALGGRDRDMVCALLTLPSPFARRYRDDLTVEVIFFGEGDSAGSSDVVLNPDASAAVKSKL